MFYLEVFELLGHDIRPHFVPFDHVVAVFRVSAHRAGPCSFVVPAIYGFGGQGEASESLEEGEGGFHCGGGRGEDWQGAEGEGGGLLLHFRRLGPSGPINNPLS